MGLTFNPFQASNTLLEKQKKRDEAESAVTNYGDFTQSDYLNSVEQLKQNAENAVNNYGDFVYKNQEALNTAMNNYLNRKDFSYDINGDALYQQYKDQYMRQGNMAMMDTMGQAAAMTGGYGNSYAQSVGQQTYQGYLQNLNDKVPELYQMAYNKYTQEGQDMLNKYSLLTDDRNNEHNMWNDAYSKLVAERDYQGNNYFNTYNKEYGAYTDEYGRVKDAYNLYDAAYNNLYNQEYTTYSDNVANQKWNAEYDLSKRSADQSALISSLQNQISGLEDKYSGYLSPNEIEAGKSQNVRNFNSGLMDMATFDKHMHKVRVGGKVRVFENYNDYVSAVLEKWYNEGKLTENEVAFIAKSRGITK